MFRIELGSTAKRFLKKCDNNLHKRLIKYIKDLSSDPLPRDVKKVVGRKEKIFRIRVEDYRIQYAVFYEKRYYFNNRY